MIYDIAIVGSGFGGSILAMVARRLGLSVVLLERESHPRFAIGESTSPLTNLIIEQIAERYDLPRLIPLTTYGAWQETYPEIVCGLKRGFTFFKHEQGRPYQAAPDRSNQLLVAASPCDALSDTHWLRSDVDAFLMREATLAGAYYFAHVTLESPVRERDLWRLRAPGVDIQTRLLIDATGPRGYLSRAFAIADETFPGFPNTQTLFSHFTGVLRCDDMFDFSTSGTPYPMDDAALHHMFDGGWMWGLRFGNGVTSAGIAVTDQYAQDINLSEGEPAWRRFLARYPSIEAQFADAEPTRAFSYWPRLSYRAAQTTGPGWAMLPSAAAFIDPLFSTGFPLTLLGIERIARALEDAWGRPELDDRLAECAAISRAEAEATAALIAGSYAAIHNFPAFTALSMFYFTAASYSEMARRVGRLLPPASAGTPYSLRQYLAADHPTFGPAMRAISSIATRRAPAMDTAAITDFATSISEAVDCLNVAGLCDPSKANWYDVNMEDVIASAGKLGFSPEAMREIVQTAPWAQGCL